MTEYEIGDTVYSKTGMAHEFLGVGYVDDTHYYRRKRDNFIAASGHPDDFSKTITVLKGQYWNYSYAPNLPNSIKRHVLAVSDGYVVYEWYENDDVGVTELSAKTVDDFLKGSTLE